MTRRVAADARGDDVVGVGTFPEMPRATAGEKPRPTASASPGYFAPPSANKVVMYRTWFGAILFLEYALVRKSVTLLKLLSHPWVSIAVHVVIDAVVLWFMNAFPGVQNTGLARQSEKEAARGERRRRATSRADAASPAAYSGLYIRPPPAASTVPTFSGSTPLSGSSAPSNESGSVASPPGLVGSIHAFCVKPTMPPPAA